MESEKANNAKMQGEGGNPDPGVPLLANKASAGPPPQYTNPGQPAPVTWQPTTGVIQTVAVGPSGTLVACPFCHHQIRTKTEMRTTKKTYLIALLLCGLGCWCCAWMPFYNDPCRDVDHYCPDCQTYLGTFVN